MFRALLAALVPLAAASVAFACPTCKESIADGSNNAALAEGFFWSILLMMGSPLAILASLGLYWLYQHLEAADAEPLTLTRGELEQFGS